MGNYDQITINKIFSIPSITSNAIKICTKNYKRHSLHKLYNITDRGQRPKLGSV